MATEVEEAPVYPMQPIPTGVPGCRRCKGAAYVQFKMYDAHWPDTSDKSALRAAIVCDCVKQQTDQDWANVVAYMFNSSMMGGGGSMGTTAASAMRTRRGLHPDAHVNVVCQLPPHAAHLVEPLRARLVPIPNYTVDVVVPPMSAL